MLQLTATGQARWVREFGAANSDNIGGLTVGPYGQITVAGSNLRGIHHGDVMSAGLDDCTRRRPGECDSRGYS